MRNCELIVFANSVKHGQHCVAGKDIQSGKWIRPVSDANGAALSHNQVKYQNPYGIYTVKPLQRILMSFSAHAPLPHQPENHIIDKTPWRQNYSISKRAIEDYLDSPEDLWGKSDRVPHIDIVSGREPIEQSLYLIPAHHLHLYRNTFNSRRAKFSYNGFNYDLSVTDPNFENLLSSEKVDNCFLCVSLGEQYKGSNFKIVAAIYQRDPE